jgi:hypothetical protein
MCIPASVAFLPGWLFDGSSKLTTLNFESASRLTQIDNYACALNWNLVSIRIPASVKRLGSGCFIDCTALVNVAFDSPCELASIDTKAFFHCDKLTSFCIPGSTSFIHPTAFALALFRNLTFEFGSRFCLIENMVFDSEEQSMIRWVGEGWEVVIQHRVRRIADGALPLPIRIRFDCDCHIADLDAESLRRCSGARSVTISACEIEIPAESFLDWHEVQTVRFGQPCQVRFIRERAFEWCSSLQSICIPRSVEILESNCFAQCESLREVTFEPRSQLFSIEKSVFEKCGHLSSICIPSSVAFIHHCAFPHYSFSLLTFEEGGRFAAIDAFIYDRIDQIVIRSFGMTLDVIVPTFIRDIGPGCFQSCRFLKRIQFEPTITQPDAATLQGSVAPVGPRQPSGLRRIHGAAFQDCSCLLSICIPASVIVLGEDCFAGCVSLMGVTFAGGSQLISICRGAFTDCTSLRRIRIPASVTLLEGGCFAGCVALVGLTVETGSKLRRIDDSVFLSPETSMEYRWLPEGTRVHIIFEDRGSMPDSYPKRCATAVSEFDDDFLEGWNYCCFSCLVSNESYPK